MKPRVDYDRIAQGFDRRYETNRFERILQTLEDFLGSSDPSFLDVGCGTGHWLTQFRTTGSVAGLDPSFAMLQKAREKAPRALLTQARAESILSRPVHRGPHATLPGALPVGVPPHRQRLLASPVLS